MDNYGVLSGKRIKDIFLVGLVGVINMNTLTETHGGKGKDWLLSD